MKENRNDEANEPSILYFNETKTFITKDNNKVNLNMDQSNYIYYINRN